MTLLSSLYPGIKGAQGVQGIQGTFGPQGTQGIQGIQGAAAGFNVTNVTSPYTLQTTDVGSLISINSGYSPISISSETFSFGNSFMIYNGTSTQQSIIAGTGVSFYSGDGTTDVRGRKYLEENDLTTILCSSNNDEFIFSTPLSFLPVITTGLILYLDAGDSSSYPGSGTTWYDLSGSGNDGTLTNGPTYSSADGGAIVFDGDNDYVDFGTITTSNPLQMNSPSGGGLTISWWGTFDGSGDDYQRIFDKSNGTNGSNGWAIFLGLSGNYNLRVGSGGVGFEVTTTQVGSTGTWENWCFTWNSSTNAWVVYLNGSQDNSGTQTYNIPSVETNARIGSWNHSTGREYNGKIANMLIYDRVLTSTEVQQNFDALKGRYGL